VSDAHEGAGHLRIVQLNAGTVLEPEWDRRRQEVAAWIERLAPDVVCLEEIHASGDGPSTAHWIRDALGDPWHVEFGGARFGPGFTSDPATRFGSAVLSRFPIDRFEYHPLPLAPDPDEFVVKVPFEVVHARTAGVDVFACHLAPAPEHAPHRVVQVLAIDEIIRAATADATGPMPPILCGDFNAEPDSDEIRFLTSLTTIAGRTTFFQDAWRVAGNVGPGFTNDWTTHPLAGSLNVHRKRIDYVFVGDPFLRTGGAGRVLAADLAFHEPLTGIQASDHAGLVVDVLWPDRPAD
jgi:endonuclease/exonuclease/phosphatase family metal-dependent hydrolase